MSLIGKNEDKEKLMEDEWNQFNILISNSKSEQNEHLKIEITSTNCEEPKAKSDFKLVDTNTKLKKDPKEEKKSSSSSSRSHHHSSKSNDKKRDRKRSSERHNKKDDEHRHRHSRHSDKKKSRSSSSCSSRSSSSVSSYKRDSHHHRSSHQRPSSRHHQSSRSHRSRSRSHSKDRRERRRDNRDQRVDSRNIASIKEKQKEELEKKKELEKMLNNASSLVNQAIKAPTVSQESTELNAADILKKIEIPKEIRYNPHEIAKFQADQLRKKAEELTGVKVPSFYNPTAINPLVYAEQQKKRKLLWSKSKDNENTSTKIVGKAIVEGQDEKRAEKFRKLMGIKPSDQTSDINNEGTSPKQVDEIQKMQKQAFEALDKEYEYARVTTHLNRGKGLGFASYAANLLLDPNQRNQFQP